MYGVECWYDIALGRHEILRWGVKAEWSEWSVGRVTCGSGRFDFPR